MMSTDTICSELSSEMEQFRLPKVDSTLENALQILARQTAFTISSCRLPDMPIVYASPAFYELTGYKENEVLGKNCRFLQGPGTSRQSVCMLNYRKDGKPFWNQLCLAPVSDQHGIAYYLGIQTNVTGIVLAQGPHGGVHNFTGCPDVVESELKKAAELGSQIKRWHSAKLEGCCPEDDRVAPVSCALLPSSLLSPLYKMQQSFILADPKLPDTPIVHASTGFLQLTGWPRDQVVGHNCRFMQGQHTDKNEVAKVREAISEKRPITVRLLNYKHDGTPFWNSLHVAPIRNADGEVVFFVGVQLDITAAPDKPARVASTTPLHEGPGSSGSPGEEQDCGLPRPNPVLDPRAKHGQRSVVGTVRVLCRSLSARSGLRRDIKDQHAPHLVDKLGPVAEDRKVMPGSKRVSMPTLSSSHI